MSLDKVVGDFAEKQNINVRRFHKLLAMREGNTSDTLAWLVGTADLSSYEPGNNAFDRFAEMVEVYRGGRSEAQLCREVGLAVSNVYNIRREKRVTLGVIHLFCKLFNEDPMYVITGTPSPDRSVTDEMMARYYEETRRVGRPVGAVTKPKQSAGLLEQLDGLHSILSRFELRQENGQYVVEAADKEGSTMTTRGSLSSVLGRVSAMFGGEQ